MHERYIEQILSAYNHIDSIIITDDQGYITYYLTYRYDVNHISAASVIGKHVLAVWPTLSEKTSTIMNVLRTGEPILNAIQEFRYGELHAKSVNSTMPIREKGRIVGTACMIKYLNEPFARKEINLEIREKSDFGTQYTLEDMKGSSKEMRILKEKIQMISGTSSSVMIYGETGTGKELVAQAIHNLSERKNKKFVSQNCAAIPENLLESILFGTVKGAYTGAENRQGLFEVANGGTLFLDEINSMELGVQAKILKAIEEKEIRRIGSTTPIKIDARIISALNEEPMQCVKKNKLRRDLFYRLSVVELDIAPLRERKEDIFDLADYYIEHYNEKMNRAILGLSDEVKEIFTEYTWPGNVRELKNVIEGSFNVTRSLFLEKEYLPKHMRMKSEDTFSPFADGKIQSSEIRKWVKETEMFSLEKLMGTIEKEIVQAVLDHSENLTEAAKKMNLSPQNLNYKLKKYKNIEEKS